MAASVLRLGHGPAVALMLLVTLLWSTAGVVSRQLEQARSFEVTFWRSVSTVLALLVLLPWLHRQQGGRGAYWRSLPWGRPAFWVSSLCWCVMFTAFMVALTLTTVGHVLITMAVGPLLTAVMAWLVIGHRIALHTGWAILAAGCGMAYMFGSQLGSAAAQVGGSNHWLGALVAFCVPVAGAVHWTVVQRTQASGARIDLVPAVWLGAVLSALITLPLALPLQASVRDVAWLAFLGVFQLAIPCVMSVLCAQVLKAPEVSLLALLEVIFGIVWAWLWAHETPSHQVLLGGGVVVAALLGNEWWGRRRQN